MGKRPSKSQQLGLWIRGLCASPNRLLDGKDQNQWEKGP